MHLRFSLLAAAAAVAACGGHAPQNDAKAPADAPAVVAAPLNLPEIKTPEAAKKHVGPIPDDPQERLTTLGTGYGLVTAMMINSDARMLSAFFVPQSVLRTPEGTLTGVEPVVTRLVDLSRSKSLRDFQRSPWHQTVLNDSTLLDSGFYVMVSKRQAKDSLVEKGSYATTWRARPQRDKWVILEDVLVPDPKGAKGKK